MIEAGPAFERFGFVLVGCSLGIVLMRLMPWPPDLILAVVAILGLAMIVGGGWGGIKSTKRTVSKAAHALGIIESMPGLAWIADVDGRFLYMNREPTVVTGHSTDDLAGTKDEEFGFRNVIHPDDLDQVVKTWNYSLRTGADYNCEHRMWHAGGGYRWYCSFGLPTRDHDGRVAGWYGTTIDINELKMAEAALRENERALQQLIDTVPVLIWCLSPQGNPTYYNKQLVEYIGVPVEEANSLGIVIETFMHPDDATMVAEAVRRGISTGEGYSLKHRLRRADGVYRWVDARAEPMRNALGEIVQWYGACFDIDGQVLAEDALRQSERKLQQLIDAVPINILSYDPVGKLTSASKRYLEYVGTPPDYIEDFEALARYLAHPDDLPVMLRRALDGFSTGTPFVNRFRRRDKHGAYPWIEARAQPLRDSSGAIVQWYMVSIDIDAEVRTLEELRERERFVWQLVETLPAMIDCAAADGEPIYRSQRLRQFLGYELEALDGTGVTRLNGTLDAGVHPDDVAGVKERYAHCLATGEPYARRHRLRRFDGEYRWVETRAEAMRNAEGTIVQWNVICLDIDGEVQAQQALRHAQERLARASQAASLAELSASIAHEVNQPLAAVVANSHACQRWLTADPPNIDRACRTAERIIRDANAAADVVGRIRALFKQSMDLRTPMPLGSLIVDVRELMAEEALRRSIHLDVELESNAPSVCMDRIQIQQVLINLMRNGMEAMDGVAIDRVLRVRLRRVAEALQVEVSDRGPGIEHPGRIFEPFFTTKEHGMGMGLAICRSIIESHGGKLWVEASEPRGATFIFTLPIEAKAMV